MKKPKLKVYDVRLRVPNAVGAWKKWALCNGDIADLFSGCRETKRSFVRRCVRRVSASASIAAPISLRIHRLDGAISEERTYPRSADPKRSKG